MDNEYTINDFTHLHVHSMYSILDGENRLENLVKQVKKLGMHQCALTDHGSMMGVLEFYKLCKKNEIKPILGVEAYITNDEDDLPKSERTRDNYHLVLIAENLIGLENLYWLTTQAQLSNYYHKPRISKKNLIPERTEGIIATSACLGNELNRTAVFDETTSCYTDTKLMAETANWYSKAFNGNYYLEIQDNDDAAGQQHAYNDLVKNISKKYMIPLVITSDAHYTTLESSSTHSLLMAMQLKKTIQEYNSEGSMKYGPWFFVRSPEQMLEAARKYDCEEAFWNTCKIGSRCNVEIKLGEYKNPVFDITTQPDYQDFLEKQKGESND